MTDIDIDFFDRGPALACVKHVDAVQLRDGQRERHVTGAYFQDIPIDPLDDMAVWDYDTAAERGFFKIDFLNNTIYTGVRDEIHLVDLLTREPHWDCLLDRTVVEKLHHINQHFTVVQQIAPRSIVNLAICLALVRPGKKHLIGRPRTVIDRDIWIPSEQYFYKKSHAVAFAASIVVQLNLLCEK